MRERLGVHLPNCQGCVLRECEDLSVLMWRAMDVTGISMKNSPRTKNCQMRSSGKRATNRWLTAPANRSNKKVACLGHWSLCGRFGQEHEGES